MKKSPIHPDPTWERFLLKVSKDVPPLFTTDELELSLGVSGEPLRQELDWLEARRRVRRCGRWTYELLPRKGWLRDGKPPRGKGEGAANPFSAKARGNSPVAGTRSEALAMLVPWLGRHGGYLSHVTALQAHGALPPAAERDPLVCTLPRDGEMPVRYPIGRYRPLPFRFGWGVETRPLGEVDALVSDLERTILDCVHWPAYCHGIGTVAVALRAAADRIDWSRLLTYLERYRVGLMVNRLGFLLEAERIRLPDGYLEALRGRILNRSGTVTLDLHGPDAGWWSARWALGINLSQYPKANSVDAGPRWWKAVPRSRPR